MLASSNNTAQVSDGVRTYLTVIEIVVTFATRFSMRMHGTMIIMVTPIHDAISAHKFLSIGTGSGSTNAIRAVFVITMVAIAIIEAR
jgi:heme/copper-type cytochrome/quinol oxidase subunit 4